VNPGNPTIKLSIILALMVGGVSSGCSNERPTQATAPETVSNVSVTVAHKATVPDWLESVGTVRAAQVSQVSSQVMANIVEIQAHEGDRVQSGQVLAVLDEAQARSGTDQATAAVAAAEKEVSAADSNFALAEATLKRYQQLSEQKSVSPQEFDEIKARYQSAEARREIARAGLAQANAGQTHARTSLGFTRIRAPFGGVVTEKRADAGTLASPGMPLFTIEDTRSFRLEVTVDESELRFVRIGQVATVTVDALANVQLDGKVAQIVPSADPASRSFLVKVQLPADSRLRSGLFGRARFQRGERSALLISRKALVDRGQLQGVYVLDANQIAELRYLTLGKSAGEQVEVLSGLQEGEKLVAAPGDRDWGGKRIAVRQ
jgi:RND family efflux transporter MFP subunit